ncbi:hypothetical protein LshimejAT787_0904940 [Lyophyllum shimeji]|uniref:Uncharacterized protein n=1 Tax=Lyophyllum shimeji TaxID=47721 RepID=A0A9P3PTK5_LYOSH|nr:hypothetical protein LshimejAT787_0904940 [Lyophyllum shimeji]
MVRFFQLPGAALYSVLLTWPFRRVISAPRRRRRRFQRQNDSDIHSHSKLTKGLMANAPPPTPPPADHRLPWRRPPSPMRTCLHERSLGA